MAVQVFWGVLHGGGSQLREVLCSLLLLLF